MLTTVVFGLALTVVAGPIKAQEVYPSLPVRVIVPGAAGGGFDVLARIFAQELSNKWGKRVFVENHGGGGGNLGAGLAIAAAPDGHTIFLGNDTLLINPSLYRVPPFDYKRDFTPIAQLVYAPNILVVHPSAKLRTFSDFMKEAKAHPGKLNVASPGNGSPGHLSLELVKQLGAIEVVHVPYRGAGPAVIDVVGGQVPLGLVGIPPTMSNLKSGALVPLAVTSSRRMKALPDVPTLREAGLPKFSVNAWMGLLAQAKLPPEIGKKIEQSAVEILSDPAVQAKLIQLGLEPAPASASELSEMMDRDYPVWRGIINRLDIKLN